MKSLQLETGRAQTSHGPRCMQCDNRRRRYAPPQMAAAAARTVNPARTCSALVRGAGATRSRIASQASTTTAHDMATRSNRRKTAPIASPDVGAGTIRKTIGAAHAPVQRCRQSRAPVQPRPDTSLQCPIARSCDSRGCAPSTVCSTLDRRRSIPTIVSLRSRGKTSCAMARSTASGSACWLSPRIASMIGRAAWSRARPAATTAKVRQSRDRD